MNLFRRNAPNELAKTHQQNIMDTLKHRLEAAKAKGEEGLINQLEQEMQQATGTGYATRAKVQLPQASPKEVSNQHRANLRTNAQHRLEVAKAKGDQSLISQLERELQQLA